MSFYRVTTPTQKFRLPFDTSECSVIQVTYIQEKKKLVKEYRDGELDPGMSLDEDVVQIDLTQEETKGFDVGQADIQVRVLTQAGKVYASQHFDVGVSKVNSEDILS